MNSNIKVGACGILCEACGLYTRGICTGCEKTQKHVEFLKSIDAHCPVLECAVANKIEVCSKDCNKFPCEKFDNGPLSQQWLEMYKKRLNA